MNITNRYVIGSALVAAIGFNAPSASAQTMTLMKFPQVHTTADGKVFNGLEGFNLDISDYTTLVKRVPDLTVDFKPTCESMLDISGAGGIDARDRCFQGLSSYKCSNLYSFSSSRPNLYDETRMTPPKPAQAYAAFYRDLYPTSKVVAINVGFFNTKPFPDRSTDQSKWKPIYQEACGRNLGTYKSQGGAWMGRYGDKETRADGSNDRPFGTLVFKEGGGIRAVVNKNIDDEIPAGDGAISGVFLRFDGTNYYADEANNTIPEFVKAKATVKTGRTAIGFNMVTKAMRVVVVQPGSGNSGGINIADIRSFFPEASWPFLMLLDGSGSSQLAADFAYVKAKNPDGTNKPTTAGRTNCLYSITVCTKKGDSVADSFVSHYASEFKENDPNKSGYQLVDRRTPNVLILRTP